MPVGIRRTHIVHQTTNVFDLVFVKLTKVVLIFHLTLVTIYFVSQRLWHLTSLLSILLGLLQVKELSGQLSGAGAPDPLVQLKEQELQIRAQADQADQAIDQAKVQLDAQNQQMRGAQFDQRLASQERQTQARIDAAMQRELLKNRGGQQ